VKSLLGEWILAKLIEDFNSRTSHDHRDTPIIKDAPAPRVLATDDEDACTELTLQGGGQPPDKPAIVQAVAEVERE
jgi:hypothetical protein